MRRAAGPSRLALLAALMALFLGGLGECVAADPGRLFYTPAQRAQLEAARASNAPPATRSEPRSASPLRFDGIVIRSDGRSVSWVNGQPRSGTSGVPGLKPGQIRAEGRTYEPYQVLRPTPGQAVTEAPAP